MASARPGILAAFAVLYVVWGTTYLGVRFILADGVPPMLLVALRYALAAAILLAWSLARGWVRPTRVQVAWSAVVGILMLTFGNGSVVVAEQHMPSGVAALMVGLVPMWLVVFQAAANRKIPSTRVLVAVATAIAGVALLSTENGGWTGGVKFWSVAIIAAGSPAWAAGSLLSRKHGAGLPLAQATGLQMAMGSLGALGGAVLLGEPSHWTPAATAPSSWLWMLYLSLAGSVAALTCYLWLLKRVSPAAAGTYAFVNPVVAVLVGAAAGDGVLSWRVAGAAALIVAAVVVVLREEARLARGGRSVPAAPADA